MLQIKRIADRAREQEIQALESEYFTWVNEQLHAEFQIVLDIDRLIAGDITNLERYLPPTGGLFLAEKESALAGMIFLTQLRPAVGQIRRMYVRDGFRRLGIARTLFEAAIREARKIGYAQLLLESPRSWVGAHALYHELGFEAVETYPESEVPEPLRKYWVFMRLAL